MTIHLWQFQRTIPLHHASDCSLLAISDDHEIYVEEFYAGEWLAQHRITLDGRFITTTDEQYGTANFTPLPLPQSAQNHSPFISAQHPLHQTALRQRGLRATDRVTEWVQPLSIMQKMPLLPKLNLNITPMQLLGIAESIILAQAHLASDTAILCRRVGLAYALPSVQHDAEGLPYDYQLHFLQLAHTYNPQTQQVPELHEYLGQFCGISLQRPSDCLLHGEFFVLADSSVDDQPSRLHIWHV